MATKRRFDNPAIEAAYIRAERLANLPMLRTAVLFGIAFHAIFALQGPLSFAGVLPYPFDFSNELIGLVIAYHVASIMVLAAGLQLLKRQSFVESRWAEFVILALYAICILAFWSTSPAYFPAGPVNERMSALVLWALFLVSASMVFIANVRPFIIWACGFVAMFGIHLAIVPFPPAFEAYEFTLLLLFLWLAIFINLNIDKRARAVFAANLEVEGERAKVEELLFNVLPQSVATRLRSGEAVADSFSDVSVIFADVVGFSQLAKTLSPGHLVSLLNRFFSVADQCAERRGIEKVKTIGDAYLAVANGTASGECGACEAVAFGQDLVAAMRELADETGIDINLRVGIHTGPVVGGVVGERRLTYDYWGDTMNIASRIESAARPNSIAMSASTFFQCAKLYEFGDPEAMILKGVGETKVYHLAA